MLREHKFDKQIVERIQKLHPFAGQDMATHTKLDIYGVLRITVRTFARMDQNCRM